MLFSTPDQSPGEMYALAVILPLITTGFVVLRFMARRLKRSAIMWDDWLVLFSLVFTYLTAIFMIVATAQGDMAEHMTITPGGPVLDEQWTMFLKMLYGVQLTQTLAIGATKISILLLYRRIFRGKWFNAITWTLVGIMVVWVVAFFFANMLECVPISESFKNAPGLGDNPHCIQTIPMYMAQVYTDVIMDVLILAVPIPLVWKLQLPLKQKLAVCGMFLLGFITTVSSCAKMIVYYLVAAEMAAVPDLSYFMTPIIYWPLIEESLQIIAACLPLLRPIMPSILGKSSQQSHQTWYTKSSYAGLAGNTEMGNIASSEVREDDGASLVGRTLPSSSTHGAGHVNMQRNEIYVQRSFKAQVDPAPAAPAMRRGRDMQAISGRGFR